MRRRGRFTSAMPIEDAEPSGQQEELRAFYLFSEH